MPDPEPSDPTHAALTRAAHATERAATAQLAIVDRSTQLAADRTVLAAERTYAAWVRTGLTALAAGIGARKLLAGVVVDWLATGAGLMLVAFSGFCFAAAVWRELARDYAAPDVRRLSPALLLVVNGALVLVAVAAFAGLATAR